MSGLAATDSVIRRGVHRVSVGIAFTGDCPGGPPRLRMFDAAADRLRVSHPPNRAATDSTPHRWGPSPS